MKLRRCCVRHQSNETRCRKGGLLLTAMTLANENAIRTMTLPDRPVPSVSETSRLVQRKCACGGTAGITDSCVGCSNKNLTARRSVAALPDFASLPFDHSFAKVRVQGQGTFPDVVQARLTISQPHDPYEQEADRVAEEVMRTPTKSETDMNGAQTSRPDIQRLCTDCEDELQRQDDEEKEEEQLLQGKREVGSIGEVSTERAAQIENLKGEREPLSEQSLNFFGRRFGRDFSDVRVLADDRAAESARAIHALAYTTGRHIVFAEGQYAPGTPAGQRMLAHELTHVVQQTGDRRVMRQQDESVPETGAETSAAASTSDAEAEGLIVPISIPLPSEISTGAPGAVAGEPEPEGGAEISRKPAAEAECSSTLKRKQRSKRLMKPGWSGRTWLEILLREENWITRSNARWNPVMDIR